MIARPKIFLTCTWPSQVMDHLRERYEVTVGEGDMPVIPARFAEVMRQFDALCPTVSDKIDSTVLETPDAQVRLIANYGVGYEHIDLAAAARAGIIVTNTPDVLTEATADLAILLMLMASRRAGEGERELRSGNWSRWRPTHLLGMSLSGKVLGLVGAGRIARETARKAQAAFGMKIAYYNRHPAPSDHFGPEIGYYSSLETLLPEVDVLSLHCPGGAETYHLLNEERLALLRPAAILINTARGSLIDEAALARALASGALAAAGLDVYEREPKITEALLDLNNVVLLPHLGSATMETRVAMGMLVAANLDAFFSGGTVPNPVG